VDVAADLPADPQAAKPMQMREGAFRDPALGARTRSVLDAAPRNA
jgi:hypothetical protein